MEYYRNMNAKYLAVVAAFAVMLVAATAFATTDSVFAGGGHGHKKKGGYEKSQATAQVNNCGNKFMPENVWCQNTASQTQGEDNSVALSRTHKARTAATTAVTAADQAAADQATTTNKIV